MTQDTFSIQQEILEHAETNLSIPVVDTEIPSTNLEPTHRGVPNAYVVFRFSDGWKTGRGAVAGARYDEMYTIIDALVVAADPTEARQLAYGENGVADVMTGFVPEDAGEMVRYRGTRSYVIGDGTPARPKRFIATVSWRLPINMIIED